MKRFIEAYGKILNIKQAPTSHVLKIRDYFSRDNVYGLAEPYPIIPQDQLLHFRLKGHSN